MQHSGSYEFLITKPTYIDRLTVPRLVLQISHPIPSLLRVVASLPLRRSRPSNLDRREGTGDGSEEGRQPGVRAAVQRRFGAIVAGAPPLLRGSEREADIQGGSRQRPPCPGDDAEAARLRRLRGGGGRFDPLHRRRRREVPELQRGLGGGEEPVAYGDLLQPQRMRSFTLISFPLMFILCASVLLDAWCGLIKYVLLFMYKSLGWVLRGKIDLPY